MTKKIIIEVGQTFSIYDSDNNVISKIKCIEDEAYGCYSCIFHKTDTCNNIECDGFFRPDGIDVHFKYIGL